MPFFKFRKTPSGLGAQLTSNAEKMPRGKPLRYAKGIREEFARRLPLSAALIDRFTGKYLLKPGEDVDMKEPLWLFLKDHARLGAATATSALALTHLPLAPALAAAGLMMLLQLGPLRKNQTLYGHEASHDNFFPRGHSLRDKKITVLGMPLGEFLGELATAVSLVQNEEDYRGAHDRHHDPKSFTTLQDDDARDVLDAGFAPGKSVAAYWRQYWWNWISPRFHARQLIARFKSNFVTARPARKIMAVLSLSVLASLALVMPLHAWIFAILVPWTWGYHIAGLSQVLNRHAWLQSAEGAKTIEAYAERTWGRFNGVPLPVEGLRGGAYLKAWTLWLIEMLFVEAPVRAASWSPDLQAHDYHHLEWYGPEEFVDDWTTMPARRQSAIDRGADLYCMRDRELWGWRNAMNHGFEKLSQAPKLDD
ncbi:hypothetical protein Q5Y75_26870 [Ruegeria sp. 2205SS24-7]|uniref:hypothetical protein n=1 Tax=Ruegeria discodermiae TaxID=3064389 RepID=UPI0027427F65|nr:hypothetical protein [Ruegeria sp. 2205SS24-7]MDP5220814.1 hypothetical protein [Ruegeria sp. 2205SS24-7]